MSSRAVTDLLENDSIYIILSLRGAQPGFHWAIFVPTNKPQGMMSHAVNRTGGWELEVTTTAGIPDPMSLCACFKGGTITSETWDTLKDTLGGVSATGEPSPNTNEVFTCRVWIRDALHALDKAGVIRLTKSVPEIEEYAVQQAELNRKAVEQGTGSAMVWNNTGFSTTS